MNEITIRPARPGEAEALSALCRRSKAHWGYDDTFLRQSEASLTISERLIASGLVVVAEDADNRIAGLASLEPLESGKFDLAHLFVEPAAIGRNVGSALFRAIADLAGVLGGTRLSVLSDPNAAGFYERMGAYRVGDAPSDAIPGRTLPLLEYALS